MIESSTSTVDRVERAASGKRPLLTHIQALRALAVSLVVIYHLWPKRLGGGYVGVDVFFVISGYLMTGFILRRVDSQASLGSALNDFYMRRIRRIAPASLATLFVVAVVTLVSVSRIRWTEFFHEILASTLYVENWSLAASSTDYLAAGVGGTPVQHFWSLSVEEQFYLFWPLLLLLAGMAGGRSSRRWIVTAVCAVLVGSFVYSLIATSDNPAAAYFDTFARLWEFAVGGLIVIVQNRLTAGHHVRAALAWVGLAAIAFSAVQYSGNTAFPGAAAAVPVLGCAAVILAGERAAIWGPQALMAWRPVQGLGNISYSVYLWHWPIIVLWPLIVGSKLDGRTKLVVLVLSVVVAVISKRLVEDPFRVRTAGHQGTRRTLVARGRTLYPMLVVAMLVVAAVAGWGTLVLRHPLQQARAELAAVTAHPPACYGGEVLNGVKPGCSASTVSLAHVVPSPLVATTGFPDGKCQQRSTRSEVITCSYGSSSPAATNIAVVGDSHATQWLPALIPLATANGWHITTYLMSGCAYSSVGSSQMCGAWNRSVAKDLAARHYRFVLVAARSLYGEGAGAHLDTAARDVVRAWTALTAAGTKVIAFADVPQPVNAGLSDIPTCVYDHSAAKCTFAEQRSRRLDLMGAAAAMDPSVSVVDLDSFICPSGVCQPVVGNVLVYLDDNHITPTFATSVSTPLQRQLNTAGLVRVRS